MWNSEGRWQGHTDIALDDIGLLQGKKVAARLAGAACDIIYSSDLIRAAATAEFIGTFHDAPIIIDAALREMCFGDFEGKVIADVYADMAEYDRRGEPYPGAESPMALFARVSAFLDGAIAKGHENIFIVSHGGTIRAIIGYFLRLPIERLREMPVDNTAIYAFEKRAAGWVMTVENDTRHLL